MRLRGSVAGGGIGIAAAVLIWTGLTPSPALADFTITKAKTQSRPGKAQPQARTKGSRTARTAPDITVREAAPLTGIDPALMREAIAGANYTATLSSDPQTRTALVEATDGKSGWSVNFSDCIDASHCRVMEFYTLWRVANEANVCAAWGNDVVGDPTRALGKPFCYTVPELPKQFHLKLSSDQAPYAGMGRLSPAEAQERMRSMIGVWASSLPMLQQAWKVARGKCPRAVDRCG